MAVSCMLDPRNESVEEPRVGLAVAFKTALGWSALLAEGEQVRGLAFGYPDRKTALKKIHDFGAVTEEVPAFLRSLVDRVRGLCGGKRADFSDVEIDLSGWSPFAGRVLAQCRDIPWGQRLSYQDLAARAGSPRAARAVGNIMARNPLPLIIPCHRVVGSGGKLGGYSAYGGTAIKQRLLDLEQGRHSAAG